MNVNLSPTFESYIKKQLDGGIFNNASEVVRDALRLKMQQDEIYQTKLETLRGKLAIGEEQAKNGQLTDGESYFNELLGNNA